MAETLIALYLLVCKFYKNGLSNYCHRISNYANLEFIDEEAITICIFGIMQKRRIQKEIYLYAKSYTRIKKRYSTSSICHPGFVWVASHPVRNDDAFYKIIK